MQSLATSSVFHVTVQVNSAADVDGNSRHSSLQSQGAVGLEHARWLQRGISLYTMLHFNVEAAVKRALFKLYLDMPLHLLDTFEQQLVVPWNIFAKVMINPAEATPLGRLMDISLLHSPAEAAETRDGAEQDPRYSTLKQGKNVEWTVSSTTADIAKARSTADMYWQALRRELHSHPSELAAEGRYSYSSLRIPFRGNSCVDLQVFFC